MFNSWNQINVMKIASQLHSSHPFNLLLFTLERLDWFNQAWVRNCGFHRKHRISWLVTICKTVLWSLSGAHCISLAITENGKKVQHSIRDVFLCTVKYMLKILYPCANFLCTKRNNTLLPCIKILYKQWMGRKIVLYCTMCLYIARES